MKINEKEKAGKKTNTYVIDYDFLTKTYGTNQVHPKIHHPVVYRVSNINRLAYEVKVSSKDSILAISEPEIGFIENFKIDSSIKQSDTIDIENKRSRLLLDSSDLTSKEDDSTLSSIQFSNQKSAIHQQIVETKELLTTASQEKIKLEVQKEILRDSIRSNRIKLDQIKNSSSNSDTSLLLQAAKEINVQLGAEATNNELSILVKAKEIKSRTEEIGKLNDVLKDIVIKQSIIGKFYDRFYDLQTTYDSLHKRYQDVWAISRANNNLISIAFSPILTHKEFKLQQNNIPNKTSLSNYRNDLAEFYQELNKFNRKYSIMSYDYELVTILKPSGIRKLMKPVNDLKLMVEQMNDIVKRQNITSTIDRMSHLIDVLSDSTTYQMTSAPIQPAQDLVLFDIEIKNRKDMDYHDARSFTYREFVKGGIRYDFSTGLVFSFGLNDYSYSKGMVTSDSVRIIANKRTNQYLPNISGMFHVSIRTWRLATLGFTIGASLSTSELDINSLFPGLSLMVGKSEKWILTAGPALKKITYLDSRYDLDKIYFANSLNDDIPTTSTFRLGTFVGVSYNLTKKQKSNFKLLKD